MNKKLCESLHQNLRVSDKLLIFGKIMDCDSDSDMPTAGPSAGASGKVMVGGSRLCLYSFEN